MTTVVRLNQTFAAPEVVATPPRLRVLHITEAQFGGIMTYLQELLSAQARSEDIESVFVLVPSINALALREVAPPNVEIRSFRHERRSIGTVLRMAIAARHIVREIEPDIVHLHSTLAGGVVRLYLRRLRDRPKIVYCPHGWFFTRAGSTTANTVAAAIERVLANTTDGILCVSSHEKKQAVAAGIPESMCVVVRNGIAEIDSPPRGALPVIQRRAGKLKTLFVGRFDYQKGFDIYLEVMRRLGEAVEGVAVGSFVLGKPKLILVPENVELVGWCDRHELHRIYIDADVLVVPSRWEAFGFVVAEAMRAGLPVFASRVGGLPELVVDNVTGRLFDSESVDQITELIRSTSRETLEDFGRKGHSRFLKSFTAARMNESLLEYYRAMTRRGVPRQTWMPARKHRPVRLWSPTSR